MRQLPVMLAVLGLIVGLAPAPARAAAIWDQWYTTTAAGEAVGYTREIFEERGDDYVYRVEDWKKGANGKFAKSTTVARARARAALDPISFKHEEAEAVVEGRRADGKAVKGPAKRLNKMKFSVKGRDQAEVKSELAFPLRTILSTFLPVWLAKTAPRIKPGQSLSVPMIPVGPAAAGSKTAAVQARFQDRDDFGRKHQAGKILISRGLVTETWWIDGRGIPVRIERADQVIERADEGQVRAFLERST